ncbi:peptide chain release factor-like protein [Thioclava sp. GXIMD4216]|uniref:Peptide chain release factor-like protein n=1 Tax=Thioclava litoralis TaxID=3076557 RepID=A0ABZ1DZJ4_9RHOB|nr:peptide chain release factor-like protein [Thioclava sp. FTW29]
MSPRETLLVSSGNGPAECRQAVAYLLEALADEAGILGLDIDISERAALHGPSSAVVVLTGSGATDMARDWEGTVLWRCASRLRPAHPRKNWFAQIFRLPSRPACLSIAPDEVVMDGLRAGGPGGQHQNKTSSAIRARWCDPQGRLWSVVVRESRSQHQNRKIAIDRLSALISADRAMNEAAARMALHDLHGQIQRGNPRRVFDGPNFRPA